MAVTAIPIRAASKEESDFFLDRYGHNDPVGMKPSFSRITFMAYAKGYVMARRPGCTPFVISEKLWRSFELFDKTRHEQ